MRLNRVLLLAASFICMALAMVFTISCSGSDGKDGSLKSCTLQTVDVAGGVNVICEGTTLGTIPAGPKGDQGPVGERGPAGSLPTGICTLGTLQENGKYSVICGGIDVSGEDGGITGSLETCTTETGGSSDKGLLVIKCPGSDDIYACGGQPFDPSQDHCEMDYPTTLGSNFEVPVIRSSICGSSTNRYDSRKEFCDISVVRPLCGGKERFEQTQLGEECTNGQVTKKCGTVNYSKYTQFCMNGTTVQNRCGTRNANGVYDTGREGDDMLYRSSIAIKGEYDSTSPSNEQCLDGKVVKRCGSGADAQTYEEKTHFCAFGDVITEHCTDRVIYNPAQRFCSYRANPLYPGILTSDPECKSDKSLGKCQQYTSTPLPYCGSGTGTAVRYNYGGWKWEYCVPKTNPTATAAGADRVLFSVFRCAQQQVPDVQSSTTSEICKCIPGAIARGGNFNGCQCENPALAVADQTVFKAYAFASAADSSETDFDDLTWATGATPYDEPGGTYVAGVYLSGLPINYTIGSGADVPSGNASFIGGVCAGKPQCNTGANLVNCTAAATCVAKDGIWDKIAGACLDDPDKCTSTFGADASNWCRDERGDCESGAFDLCPNFTKCKAAGGVWDNYVSSNKCVSGVSRCNSQALQAGNGSLCAAPAGALVCDATTPYSPLPGASACLANNTTACTSLGGTVSGTSCVCSAPYNETLSAGDAKCKLPAAKGSCVYDQLAKLDADGTLTSETTKCIASCSGAGVTANSTAGTCTCSTSGDTWGGGGTAGACGQ